MQYELPLYNDLTIKDEKIKDDQKFSERLMLNKNWRQGHADYPQISLTSI